MASLFNLVAMTVSSAFGTSSNIPLGTAATINGVTYLTFALSGTSSGTSIDYSILDTGASEIGTATYLSSGPFLSVRTPTKSTNGGAAIVGTSAAVILCSPRAETLNDASVLTTGTLSSARLADVITAAGPIGSATTVPIITFDSKGRLTAVSSAVISIGSSNVSGLAAIATSGSASDLTTGTVPAARIPFAAQSDQETATSTSVVVNPGVQQFHPSAYKFWVKFDGTGTPAVTVSYNTASITDNATGDWTVNLTTNFSSTNWFATCLAGTSSGGTTLLGAVERNAAGGTTVPQSTSSIRVNAYSAFSAPGTATDTKSMFVSGAGDQ